MASAVYAVLFTDVSAAWLAIDGAIVVGLAFVVGRKRAFEVWELATFALAFAAVLASQLLVADRNGIWIDESNYIATLHAGVPLRDGTSPFCWRWLEPILAGRLNLLPARGVDGLKALNFGALVVAATCLSRVIARLGVSQRLALAAPILFVGSHLGAYAASNRLLTDPFNYALFVFIFAALYLRELRRALPWLLLFCACTTEKVAYWLPVIVAVVWLEHDKRWRDTARALVRVLWPVAVYALVAAVYFSNATRTGSDTFGARAIHMGMMPQYVHSKDDAITSTTFQMAWFPFGALTVFAVLGLRRASRAVAMMALLVVPVAVSIVIATDVQRMAAYGFIAAIPLALIYLDDALAAFPPWCANALLALLCLTPLLQTYARTTDHTRSILAAIELLTTFAIVWIDAISCRR